MHSLGCQTNVRISGYADKIIILVKIAKVGIVRENLALNFDYKAMFGFNNQF